MIELNPLEDHCNRLLNVAGFSDYCPNGLQVEGNRHQIRRIVSGVTASLELIEAAAARDADLLLVHHGWFWRNEPRPVTGMRGKRMRRLMESGMSLLAYHLPLDAHPQLGNNRRLGDLLGFSGHQPVEEGSLVWGTQLAEPMNLDHLSSRVETILDRKPLLIAGRPSDKPRRSIAWCTGGAQSEIETAAALGFQVYLSGEISESTTHAARELGIDYICAGHHATERYGVQALGSHLAETFDLEHVFVDLDNPV